MLRVGELREVPFSGLIGLNRVGAERELALRTFDSNAGALMLLIGTFASMLLLATFTLKAFALIVEMMMPGYWTAEVNL